MKKEIFREYDIRGVVGRDFDLADAGSLGKGYGAYLQRHGGRRAVVGRDCRLSSPEVGDALIDGLLAAGIDVVDLGVCPSPLVYYGIRHLAADGGVMVTASHNPPEYNGFKICLGTDTIFGEEIQNLRRLIEAGEFPSGEGTLETFDIITAYSEYLVKNLSIKRPLKVAVDAGNGTGGVVAVPILEKLGCRVHPLYIEMDGRFPNHEPDPTVAENLADLSRTVVENGLDLGVAFDGDADRIGVVDEKGRIIYGDMLMIIYARDILESYPAATFIGEVKCSNVMYDEIERLGGQTIMWRTGHSLIKQKMKETHALLAGEMSGHMFFGHRYFGFDDGVYAACRLLEILARKDVPLSSLLDNLPQTFNTPEIRVDCPEDQKFKIVEMVKEKLGQDHDIIDVDGVRVKFPDGWGLLRASNTSPVLVLRFEAQSPERLDEIRKLVEGALEEIKAVV